jgi:hypothetical protein
MAAAPILRRRKSSTRTWRPASLAAGSASDT